MEHTAAFVSTSIPYVNASPHIGHAFEYVQADTIARILRTQGCDVFFTTGADENAIKNIDSAHQSHLDVQSFVDIKTKEFIELTRALNIQNDVFIRTSDIAHHVGCQKIWNLCQKDIYKKVYKGLYCTGCENFYDDGEFENNICPNHKKKLEFVEEENYFFSLSKYQNILDDLISSNKLQVLPLYRREEVLNFIRKGLQDFSISRPTLRTSGWGVPVPNDSSQRMYVWFDALTNYITALGFGSTNETLKQKYWDTSSLRIHVVGKDIIKFHAIYWPAMLYAAGLTLPTHIFTHGFLTIGGVKMSKTLGNVINPHDIIKTYGTEPLRYYFTREVPQHDDGDFSFHRLAQIYESELANELGNTVSRVCTLAAQDTIRLLPKSVNLQSPDAWFMYQQTIHRIRNLIIALNKDINIFQPWKKLAQERADFLQESLQILNATAIQLLPYIPQTARKIIGYVAGDTVVKPVPLFPKLKTHT